MSREPLAKLEYTKGEDGMLYPNLQISVNKEYDLRPTGMFGRRWKDYMKSKYPQRLSELIALGQINELIAKVDEEAEAKKETLIQQNHLSVKFACDGTEECFPTDLLRLVRTVAFKKNLPDGNRPVRLFQIRHELI